MVSSRTRLWRASHSNQTPHTHTILSISYAILDKYNSAGKSGFRFLTNLWQNVVTGKQASQRYPEDQMCKRLDWRDNCFDSASYGTAVFSLPYPATMEPLITFPSSQRVLNVYTIIINNIIKPVNQYSTWMSYNTQHFQVGFLSTTAHTIHWNPRWSR